MYSETNLEVWDPLRADPSLTERRRYYRHDSAGYEAGLLGYLPVKLSWSLDWLRREKFTK